MLRFNEASKLELKFHNPLSTAIDVDVESIKGKSCNVQLAKTKFRIDALSDGTSKANEIVIPVSIIPQVSNALVQVRMLSFNQYIFK